MFGPKFFYPKFFGHNRNGLRLAGVRFELGNINLKHLCKYTQSSSVKWLEEDFKQGLLLALNRTLVLSDKINYPIRK